jgi:thioredoxin
MGQIRSLNADEFEKQLLSTKGEQLIDVRTPQEYEKYRIAGAKNIDLKSPDFRKEIEKLDKTKPVLIYCLSGVRSKSAADICQKAGFKVIYELEGGINAWSKAGKPIDQDLTGTGELSSKDYKTIISSSGYVLVDFYAPWCEPCRKMLPIVEDLSKTYPDKFKLLTINFDQNRLLAKEQNITSVPYLIVFKDGKKIWDKNGKTSKDELMKILNLK